MSTYREHLGQFQMMSESPFFSGAATAVSSSCCLLDDAAAAAAALLSLLLEILAASLANTSVSSSAVDSVEVAVVVTVERGATLVFFRGIGTDSRILLLLLTSCVLSVLDPLSAVRDDIIVVVDAILLAFIKDFGAMEEEEDDFFVRTALGIINALAELVAIEDFFFLEGTEEVVDLGEEYQYLALDESILRIKSFLISNSNIEQRHYKVSMAR